MIINENDMVSEDGNETIINEENTETTNDVVVDSLKEGSTVDSSNNIEDLSSEDTNVENSNDVILNYLDPKILEVKEYTYDELNANIEYGNKETIKEKLITIKKKREGTQPIKTKTGGSSFKNPIGRHASELIEMAGCKGLKVGDAVVSKIHANFLINTSNATAEEIEHLGKLIIEKVYDKFQILLEWEIKIVGEIY